jgi:unsaturated rhamnogalacturonyl hydrolase
MNGSSNFMIEKLQTISARAATQLLSHRWKVWFWGDSIGLEGLLDASEVTGNQMYQGFAYGLLKSWIAREKTRGEFDYTAPGVALLRVYEKTKDVALLEAALRHAQYMASFRRTQEGAYLRYENAAIELPPELPQDHPDTGKTASMAAQVNNGGPCVFVDSVHFDGPFFSKLYQVTGEEKYRQLALQNILPQIDLLFDPAENLFHHFWMERTRSRNGVLWGRGNGWGMLGLIHTLEYLPPEDAESREILAVFQKLALRLRNLQESHGGWHTVLNDPSSYVETSIAAFVVDAFSHAVRRNWLEQSLFSPVIDSAFTFLLEKTNADGLLTGVSYETFPSTRIEHYRTMPRNALVPWGQGPLLTAIKSYAQLMGWSLQESYCS